MKHPQTKFHADTIAILPFQSY